MTIPNEQYDFDGQFKFTIDTFRRVGSSLCQKLNTVGGDPDNSVDRAFHLMQIRMVNAMNSLELLDKEAKKIKDGSFNDAAIVLRSMYDLHLQFLYILKDPVVRSRNYMNFAAVDSYRLLEAFTKHPSNAHNALKQFDLPAMKARVEADYNRVKNDFLTVDQKKVRPDWYVGKLDGIAHEAGYDAEYAIMQKILSNIIHSGSMSLTTGLVVPQYSVLHDGWMIMIRVVGGIAKYLNVRFDELELSIYDQSLQSIY